MLMTKMWQGKIVVVTGAASGIGDATGRLLKKLGAHVIALDRCAPQHEAADQHIEFDQGDRSSIERACDLLPGPIDALFNIAGMAPTPGGQPADLLFVNFFGLRILTERVARRTRAGAAVVNMSSHAGWRWRENAQFIKPFLSLVQRDDVARAADRAGVVLDGLGDRSAYPISKQLLNLWTAQSIAGARLGEMRMNAVSCAGVDTPILNDFLTSFGEDSAARIRAIGLARPEDIAPALVFLASPEARWIKGAVVPIDGGAIASAILKEIDA